MREDSQQLDISTFLVSSIHDMKNSLGVMAAFLEDALSAQGDLHSPGYDKTAHALYEAQRINDHLIQLLALYKIDQAFYPFDPQERRLLDLAQDALARVAQLAQFQGIALECDCPPELSAWLDYDLVFGVVVQALHNALLYSRSRVLLIVAPLGGGVSIRVEDDGAGYPGFLLEQGDALGKGVCFHTGSTGLGLYFAGVAARLHSNGGQTGTTRLENGGQLGGGCFVLELP